MKICPRNLVSVSLINSLVITTWILSIVLLKGDDYILQERMISMKRTKGEKVKTIKAVELTKSELIKMRATDEDVAKQSDDLDVSFEGSG